MSRFSHYDTDEERLPDGMTRVGYDADTQVYTFRDVDGSLWNSAPGCQYGQLTRVSAGADHEDEGDEVEPFLPNDAQVPSWRHDMMPLLNFGVIIGVSLLLFFWYLHYAASSAEQNGKPAAICPSEDSIYTIEEGDTCWDIGLARHITIEDVLKENLHLDCDALLVGSAICLPR